MEGLSRGARRRWPVLFVIAVITATFTLGCGSSPVNDTSAVDNIVGDAGQSLTRIAPEDRKPAAIATGPDLDGTGTVTTDGNLGKVVVINVWGSWCAPCRKEAPDLAAASVATKDIAVFVGIDVRDPSPEPARAFVRTFEVPYPSIYDPNGTQLLPFAGDLAPNGIPTTLIIDRQGRSAARVVGIITETTLVQLIRDVSEGK